jgi:hypothetical protein
MTIIVKLNSSGVPSLDQSITLRNDALAVSTRRLDTLLDVQADSPGTLANSTLVYDPTTDKYIVKQLDLNGGTF